MKLLLLAQISVADVVDTAGERVHGAHSLALGPGQQADTVIEIRCLSARDLLAAPRRVFDLQGRDGHRPIAARTNKVANRRRPGRSPGSPASYSSRSSARRPPATRPATARRGRGGGGRASGAPPASSARARAASNASSGRQAPDGEARSASPTPKRSRSFVGR